jgi:CheY-like chemotaxis protein
MMTVRDTGVGIDAEGMSHLFEPFYTTKEKDKGTGLGLASVYGILRQSSGFVWAESSLGEGACFTVCLPRTEKLARVEVCPNLTLSMTTPATLLVVDDSAEVRNTLAEHAKSLGYKVLTASPEGVLELAQQYAAEINVLITDVVMPRSSGPQLAGQLKAINPRIKVLFMSGYSDLAADSPDTVHTQAVLLNKPFGRVELALKIKEALSR